MSTISPEFRLALARLSLKPGRCPWPGCEEGLLLVVVEPYEADTSKPLDLSAMPPPRFACPKHEVWITECFDEGYPDDATYSDGLYHAVLRDLADPAWEWLPEPMRPAAMKAGLAVIPVAAGFLPYPRFLVGTYDGRTWVTDRRTLLDAGPASEAEEVLKRANIRTVPVAARARAIAEHRLTPHALGAVVAQAAAGRRVELRPSHMPAPWDGCQRAGEALVPGSRIELITDLYGEVSWRSGGETAPVAAEKDGQIVAVVMPINPGTVTAEPDDGGPAVESTVSECAEVA